MGEVWRVRRPDLGIERAVKLLLPGRSGNRETIARMLREAQAMARLNHPHAVVVHDVCLGDVPYIEMEFVRGRTLDRVLREHEGPLTTDLIAEILDQLCNVLQVAHKNAIVHRDLKPSNLMLVDDDGSGEVNLKVLDFGISKFLDANPEEFHTQDGQTLGTLMYMSPEQVCSSKDVDARSDIYSVGVILYELLTGRLPFTSRYPMIYQDILSTPAPPFQARNPDAQVLPAIEKLVLRCLEKEPGLRPGSVKELATEFLLLANPEEPEDEVVPDRGPDRRRILVALASVAGLGGLGLYRLLRPASLSVNTVPIVLDLHAGKPESISVLVTPEHLASKVRVSCEVAGLPPGVVVTPESATDGRQHQFSIESDPNLIPQTGPVRHSLKFKATDGRTERTSSVALVIHPPDVAALPDHWVRAREGTKLVAINGKYYPWAIERTFPGKAGVVVALLIPKQHARQPDPFYIMRDKVWIGLFEAFVRASPQDAPADQGWREGGDPRLPVRNVTAAQAQAFAEWLGGRGRGFLPTFDQWDQAAGFNLKKGPGPFQGPWDPKDPSQIAVAVKAPMPVGQASRDISPYGCRDMSGNGWEWTRPLDASASKTVVLRGNSYKLLSPLMFEDSKRNLDGAPSDLPDPEIGFRVIFELDPIN
jgi:serine/threonine protein kinase